LKLVVQQKCDLTHVPLEGDPLRIIKALSKECQMPRRNRNKAGGLARIFWAALFRERKTIGDVILHFVVISYLAFAEVGIVLIVLRITHDLVTRGHTT
jgi:hypothetical protein